MGKERRSKVISEDQRKRTAYHETGHALVACLSDGADPVHKISIIPRGMALGLTQMLPDEDRYSASKTYLETQIAIFMGGRVAEELIFDEISTGASDDLRRATAVARSIVSEYGMTEALGPVTWTDKQEQVFLGREIGRRSEVSEHTARLIDEEVRRIVTEGYVRARKLLLENLHVLHKVSQVLLERETLGREELTRIVGALAPIYPGDAEGVA
jgi:cell division protease FtsH